MKPIYSIITIVGFIFSILSYFLQITQQTGSYIQGFGAGLLLCGSGLTIYQFVHERKLKSKKTVDIN